MGFIFGLLALSCVTGLVIVIEPTLFYPILVIDLWFLGYHHVISTFTRICFDKESFQEHKSLVFGLLPIVVVATLSVAWIVGLWVIVTIYFYWQWYHYTRQSWGISRAYRGRDKEASFEDGWLDQTIFYSVPVLGILSRSAEQHPTFIGLELWSVPVPTQIADFCGYLAIGLLAYWLVARMKAASEGRLAVVHTMYMMTHFAIFYLAYIATSDITLGWLMINIWHNAQYILFVWLFNTNRFKNGVDAKAPFLSRLSQPGNMLQYMLVGLAITAVVYFTLALLTNSQHIAGLPLGILIYQTINFHHYIVDSRIWKVRKKPMRKTLELNGA